MSKNEANGFDSHIITDTLGQDKQYDLLVFIGRFSPLHLGHQRVIDIALQRSKKVLVLVGSTNSARTLRNPFKYEERYAMIASQYEAVIENKRLIIDGIEDYTYAEDMWIQQVQTKINKNSNGNDVVGLIGCEKDHTSYYLGLFPHLHNVGVEFKIPLNSTDVRKAVFFQYHGWQDKGPAGGNEFWDYLDSACAPEVSKMLHGFMYTKVYEEIREEWKWIEDYRAKRQTSNYPVIDVTVDACVVQSGHVLVVKRKHRPGKGLYALPGGFLNVDEPIHYAQLRELREETCIDLSDTILRANMVKQEVFSNPKRSDRGRIITHACLIKLQDRKVLPKVKGADDAESAFWLKLSDVKPEDFFEDHGHIIRYLVGAYSN